VLMTPCILAFVAAWITTNIKNAGRKIARISNTDATVN